jgi:predicted nucleic acid-binding protein
VPVIELADTSALILARRDPSIGESVRAATARNEIAICDMVELEYLMGARKAADYDSMVLAFAGFPRLEIEPADWARARAVHRSLAHQGAGHQRSAKLPDLIIAAVAERHEIPILHYDEDYDRIAAITGQATRWVAERGFVS